MGLKNASVIGKKKKSGLAETNLKTTRWSEAASKGETLKEYPRPSMRRDSWINLNGWWDYSFTRGGAPYEYDGKILVPFSPESELSGVHRQLLPEEELWYFRKVTAPELAEGMHYLLHFGAVDQSCRVYVDGEPVAEHMGGYLPFSVDIYQHEFDLAVCVTDVSDTSYHSRGKQKLARGGMYYTAQSGIWQTVWMEPVPDRYLESVRIDADYDTGDVIIQKTIRDTRPVVAAGGLQGKGEPASRVFIDTLRIDQVHGWTPEDPHLYKVKVSTFLKKDARGDLIKDEVECYFAFRKLEIRADEKGIPRFWLNDEICIQTGVLDQGYWCDGLYTAPSDEAMIYDIKTMKKLGFNMIRKHIKIEPERWYYHCDRLGMLVWQDMVNGGSSYKDWFVTYLATAMNVYHLPFYDGPLSRYLLARKHKEGRKEFLKETDETIKHLYNHPSIVAWVPFNEGWGQFDAVKIAEFVRRKDKNRWIDHASGWFDQGAGDMVSLHHYFFGLHFEAEYKRVLVLSEFGGYTWQVKDHSFADELYGYGKYDSKESLTKAFADLYKKEVLDNIEKGISGFVYTQLSDVEEEANGILTYDREVLKFDEDLVADINQAVKTALVSGKKAK